MDKQQYSEMTNEELLVEKKKMKNSKILHALAIGFLAGILIFGFVSWGMSEKKRVGFLIPMLIPITMIYRIVKSPNKTKELEEVLKERNLN